MENQLSVTLAKHVDPQGERTIGLSIADDKHSSLTTISDRDSHET